MSGPARRDRPESRGDVGGARARILARVARAAALRDKLPHPGRLETPAPAGPDPTATFVKLFTSQGGEVATPGPDQSPRDWLTSFIEGLGAGVNAIAIGPEVPARLQPRLSDMPAGAGGESTGLLPRAIAGEGLPNSPQPSRHGTAAAGLPPNSPQLPPRAVPPEHADAGISLAWGAVAETGSLILPSTGTRAVQLLPRIHIIWVPAGRVFARLEDALLELRAELPAGVGLHSGPSKSADIGQTVVTGVHGPGRCIAVLES